jgi:hypothetical protein
VKRSSECAPRALSIQFSSAAEAHPVAVKFSG